MPLLYILILAVAKPRSVSVSLRILPRPSRRTLRWKTSHLRKNRVPWDPQKLWLGHANKDVTDRYAEQLKEDIDWRKEEAEKAGLGFKLPSLESVFGLLGLPKQQKSKLKKVA